ncbi:DUF1573 domain-containing protein [Clostridium grantii]|uniref:DUF1573 domain-containing protein n=1 Tax=Clostridium grantii DSM 8605 TaxID=1121316 RepID=A0A1M5XPK7_9CLOT|nr:DUF1573 domain-containing protein [Clostridium grantii]SHI01582.1 hypothetical protein SAMN02745207_03819 [Clostridium grantii DSM 8605]
MKDVIFDHYQNAVSDSLLRHKSLLDIMTKLEESQAKINRSLAKSVTNCGCIEIKATKQHIPENKEPQADDYNKYFDTHLKGKLCDECRENIEDEIGNDLFYLASLCNLLDLNLYDILLKEYNQIATLGKYSMK